MKTGIYWQDPEYPAKGMDFIFDPSLVLYLPLHHLDGASFMSKDAYGHVCSVTGALWRPQGRYFDGLDDRIDCGDKAAFELGTSDYTLEAWVKPVVDGTRRTVFSKYATDVYGIWIHTDDKWHAYTYDAMGGGISTYSIDAAVADRWYHLVAIKYPRAVGGAYQDLYIDGEFDNQNYSGGVADLDTSGASLFVGSRNALEHFKDTIGEVRIYRRALTPLEIQHNYLATKWRYQ